VRILQYNNLRSDFPREPNIDFSFYIVTQSRVTHKLPTRTIKYIGIEDLTRIVVADPQFLKLTLRDET
jgi:hypothetical protein